MSAGSECKTDSSSLIGIKSSKKLRRDPFHSPDEGQSPLTLSPQAGSPFGLDVIVGQQRVLSSGSPKQYPSNVAKNGAPMREVGKCRDNETLPAEGMTETQKAFDRLRVKNADGANGDTNRRAAIILEEGLSPHSPKKRKARASVQDEPCTLTFGDLNNDISDGSSLELGSNAGDDHAESPGEQCRQLDQIEINRKHRRNEKDQTTLKDLLVQFGHIELNKDFYDSIKRTESRTDLPEPSIDVREVDRQAFNSALSRVKHILRDELPRMQEEPLSLDVDVPISELEEQRALDIRALESISTIAHCIMQHLVETATPSSSGVTLEVSDLTGGSLSRAKSSARSSVQISKQYEVDQRGKEKENDNSQVSFEPTQTKKGKDESIINHQVQPGKHPRETNINSGVRKKATDESPQISGAGSLVSNEPPKRQRKHIHVRGANEDEASSKAVKTADTLVEVELSLDPQNLLQKKPPFPEEKGSYHSRPMNSIGSDGGTTHSDDSSSSSEGKPKKQEWDEASNASVSMRGEKNKLISHVQMDNEQGQRSTSYAPRWGSSLVCADLSLNDVGSKLYWPLLSSLKTKLEVRKDMEEISAENNFKEMLTDEIQNHAKDVSEKIRHEIDAVYEEFGSVRKVAGINIALVAAAFEALIYEFVSETDHEDTVSR